MKVQKNKNLLQLKQNWVKFLSVANIFKAKFEGELEKKLESRN